MAYPHVPIDEQLKRIREANARHPEPRDITILGAGIAGLAAAYELRELGHTVTLYEASDRIGGRIFTYRFGPESDGLYGELGAMRIPASHDYTRYYISKFQLKLRNFITVLANGEAFLDFRGKVARIKDGQTAVYPLYQLSGWERTQYPGAAIFGRHLESLIGLMTPNEVTALFDGFDSTPTLQYLDDISLGDFLRQRAQAADSMELMGSFTSLEGWLDMSVTMFLRDTIVDTSDGLQEIVGGTDLLPRALANTMADRIHTNTVVQAIAASTDGVKVLLSTSNEGQVLSAKQVLTTIPFSVMRRLDLSGFSDDKLTSIRSLNYAAASKVILNMKERFWETRYGIFGGASISDRMARQTYYPSDHADENTETPAPKSPDLPRGVAGIAMLHRSILKSPNHRAGGPGVLLASYTLGQDATRMAALAPSERESVSMKDISRYHPEIEDPGMVIGSASMAWSTYPWSAGAFSFLWPRQLGRLYQAAIRNENQVYFAGEHCSTDQAWIQGALISALRAVEEIVSAP